MNSLAQCFYTLGHVTRARRASETPSFGTLETYNGREARERGFYDDVCVCLDHSRIRYDEFRRCAFCFDADRLPARVSVSSLRSSRRNKRRACCVRVLVPLQGDGFVRAAHRTSSLRTTGQESCCRTGLYYVTCISIMLI